MRSRGGSRDFEKGGTLYIGHHAWPAKKKLGFRWSKMAEITLETISVYNFQSMKTPVELNSLLSKFFCYITWFVISPD